LKKMIKIRRRYAKIIMGDSMELLDVLDINGNKTGEVLDRDIIHNNNIMHLEVYCIIINDKKEVLLQKRAACKKHNPNIYALTAGHVETGEDIKSAMVRELKEELSLDVKEEELKVYRDKEIKIREKNSNVSYYFYIICNKKAEEFILQKDEVSEVKWFSVNEITDAIRNKDSSFVWDEGIIPLFEIINTLNI